MSEIKKIFAREILDPQGNPTSELGLGATASYAAFPLEERGTIDAGI